MVNRGSCSIRALSLALLGLVFLAGCPSAGNVGQGTPVAGVTEGVRIQPQMGSDVCLPPPNAEIAVQQVLGLVNEERVNRGFEPLTVNPVLAQMADDYACDMIVREFFEHNDPDGKGPGQRAIEAGYLFLAIGENLAGGQTTPAQVMREWMASTAGHRENILSPQWSQIGIAVRAGGEFGVYWVQEFGNPP